MRIVILINNCGFILAANDYDVNMGEKIVFTLKLFWRNCMPVRNWAINKGENFANFRFVTIRNGKRSGWEFQGPIRRIE